MLEKELPEGAAAAQKEFAVKVAPEVAAWVGEDVKLCIIALPIDGGMYALCLADELETDKTEGKLQRPPEVIYLTSLKIREEDEKKIANLSQQGYSFLLVEGGTQTGGTFITARSALMDLGVREEVIKHAVHTDRTGRADFAYTQRGGQPLHLITFSENYKKEGFETIFRAGTVVWTQQRGVYRVDKKCIEALKRKEIPFVYLNPQNGSDNRG